MLDWSIQFHKHVQQQVVGPRRTTWDRAVRTYGQQALADQGDVASESPWEAALWQAQVYQRSHINAFRSVLRAALTSTSRQEPITIIDVGCGAGSVAFAFHEEGFTDLRYVGHDHHGPTRHLARRMLEPLGDSLEIVGSQEDLLKSQLLVGDLRNLYLTCSYVTGQSTFDLTDVEILIDQVNLLANLYNQVYFVAADADFPESRLKFVAKRVTEQLNVDVLMSLTSTRYEMQYPGLEKEPVRKPSESPQTDLARWVNGFAASVTESIW